MLESEQQKRLEQSQQCKKPSKGGVLFQKLTSKAYDRQEKTMLKKYGLSHDEIVERRLQKFMKTGLQSSPRTTMQRQQSSKKQSK